MFRLKLIFELCIFPIFSLSIENEIVPQKSVTTFLHSLFGHLILSNNVLMTLTWLRGMDGGVRSISAHNFT